MRLRPAVTLILSLLGLILLTGIAPSASAQDQPLLYITEWQIPHAQWAIWEAFEQTSYKPMFEKLMDDHAIQSWGLYTHTIHTPDGPTHGLWFSAAGMKGVEAALNAMAGLPSNSV